MPSSIIVGIILIFVIIGLIEEYPIILLFIVSGIIISIGIYMKHKEALKVREKQIIDKKRQLIQAISINKIDQMDANEFVKFLNDFFCISQNYSSIPLPKTRDFGADIILNDENGYKIAIQVKLYIKGHFVNISAIQQIAAAKMHYNCNEAMVITNNYFTEPAIILANSNNVILWDREQLAQELLNNSQAKSYLP
ncbi:MAG: restriction endonuclease [bacterium]